MFYNITFFQRFIDICVIFLSCLLEAPDFQGLSCLEEVLEVSLGQPGLACVEEVQHSLQFPPAHAGQEEERMVTGQLVKNALEPFTSRGQDYFVGLKLCCVVLARQGNIRVLQRRPHIL